MNPEHQRLNILIERATSETLVKPEIELYSAVCDAITKKSDM